MAVVFMDGNEALARGAVTAGCSFFAGYPITPATTILNIMLKMLPSRGGVCLQGEDEIASIGFCIGASMAGRKVLTATSGPGISLYSEQISFAVGSEIPLVIADIQRLGPSTGSATRGADGDIQFLRWGCSGGAPVIVLAPVDAPDCYRLAVYAFNFAEEFRCPVFVASNKEIGMTKESFDMDEITLPKIVNRTPFSGDSYLPFEAESVQAPSFLPIGGGTPVRQTSSTHGPDGYITIDPGTIAATQARLRDKIENNASRLILYEETVRERAGILLIGYGVTARAMEEAAEVMTMRGTPVSTLTLKTLWPVPVELLRSRTQSCNRVFVCEMNMGQYVREVERALKGRRVEFIGKMDGTLLSPAEIMEGIADG